MALDSSKIFGKRCLSIQSHVVHGYVGNKSAIFPLQLLGFDVDPFQSVQLSNHTGYTKFLGQVLSGDDFNTVFTGLEVNGLLSYSHVLTGYVSSASFLRNIASAVAKIREVNPSAVYLCDPVMGDHGHLYVPADLVPIYRDEIVPLASILTPNQFECETLTDRKITDIASAFEAMDVLHAKGVRTVVLTSSNLPAGQDDTMLFLASCPWEDVAHERADLFGAADKGSAHARFAIRITKLHSVFTGTGDLTAALLLAHAHEHPGAFATACEKAIATVQTVCKRTLEHYESCVKALESAKEHPSPATKWLLDAAASSSGQMGKVVPAFNELRLVQSKADIEHPVVPDDLRAFVV